MDKEELYCIADNIQDRIGVECFLDSILKAMSEQELKDMLEYIDRMEDLNLFPDEEEEYCGFLAKD